ncbi:serine-rich coiled-coil domain-containing protein 1 [Sorex fumeus]|uniref:serine-rich coiled-coil domain-containing protein 1 n=1 Tax=Sorex fumeus TaxID=62283 RepID=UPI0024AE328E|nr:serine-rich coiled-coil domain-containing protein 1 [Sorex fumeus]
MGDPGPRRATLVSRLPIFRRSLSRRHATLPSWPSPGGPSSSPSNSTNSSSGSSGKRRSIFRTPSISFRAKKDAAGLGTTTSSSSSSSSNAAPRSGWDDTTKGQGRARPASGGSSRGSRRLPRSLTEELGRARESPGSKSVFMNCLGAAGPSEGDDSGFAEERAQRPARASGPKRLLGKSLSSHCPLSPPAPPPARLPLDAHPPPDSCPLPAAPSPLPSADLTTAPTPSDFLTPTEGSLSEEAEAEALASPGDPSHNRCPTSGPGPAAPTSPGPCRPDSPGPPPCAPAAAAHAKEVSPRPARSAAVHAPGPEPPPLADTGPRGPQGPGTPWKPGPPEDQQRAGADRVRGSLPVSDSRTIAPARDPPLCHRAACGHDPNPAKVLASSLSPYREGRFVERRLRSSSEGTAGSGRTGCRPREASAGEDPRKQRADSAGSASSRMNSLDVLNNLGSCELDEDDLMLDLEFLEDQNLYPPVCREDSYHSVASCAAVVLTPVEPTAEMKKREELKFPEPSRQSLSLKLTKDADPEARCAHAGRVPRSPSPDCALAEENGGLDSLPFRLMLQDCTAVKTLLLKMKRVLQESSELSPARSTSSLPVSPLTEEPLPFKDIMKDECSVLKLQLKERDELICQLQEELEKFQHLQKAFASRVDKSTQTEVLGYDGLNLKRLDAVQGGREATYRNRIVSQSLSTRDRKVTLTPTEDRCRHAAADQTGPFPSKTCQLPSVCLSNVLKDKELVDGLRHSRGAPETLPSGVTQNSCPTGPCNSLKSTAKAEEFSMFSEKPKDRATVAGQYSPFTGRFGQPPRGPISLHMYSRKNVFLNHSLHTTELQALGQHDG